jgi:predicted ATP-dependent protease
MVPVQNVKNLMLRPDVVQAVARGEFHIYAVSTIDEGIEILTGVPAGERDAGNLYAQGTVNYRVEQRLKEFSEKLRKLEKEERPDYAAESKGGKE